MTEVLDAAPRPEQLLSAARRALARRRLDLAESLATSARHFGGGWPADQLLAEILVRCGRYSEAAAVQPSPPPNRAPGTQRTRWAVTAAAIRFWGAGDAVAAEGVLAQAGGPVAEVHRAWVLLLDGRPRAALAAADGVLRDRCTGSETLVPAAATVTVAASLIGQFDRAMAAYDRGGAIAAGSVSRTPLDQAGCFALLLAGRMGEALRLAENGQHDVTIAGATAAAGRWAALRGTAARMLGDPGAAIAAFHTATGLLDGRDSWRLSGPCLAELAGACALSGEAGRAEWTMRHAAGQPRPCRVFAAWVELNRAWTTACAGDVCLAAKRADRAADLAMATEQLAVEAMARYDVARLGDPKAVRHRLAELAGQVRGSVVPVMSAAAAALADADADGLDRAAAAFAGLELNLYAAETATAAAALHRRAGRSLLAGRSMARAAGAARSCPHATTPLLRLGAALVGLTRRERDVALLAAGGLASATIADRLRLSVRTVDNYLGRIYQKLGVAGRRELAPLVGAPTGAGPTAPVSASSAEAARR